jgi:hypothetical protein
MTKKLNSLSSFLCREGGKILASLSVSERGLLISAVASTLLSARDSNPWLIAQVLLRGLNASSTRISVYFSGLELLARSLNSGRVRVTKPWMV